MKQYIVAIFWILVLGAVIYFEYGLTVQLYKSVGADVVQLVAQMIVGALLAGVAVASLVYEAILSGTSDSLKVYKRELEKESIDKTENSSRVKVLESKIQVLEKALDEALKK